MTSPSDLEHCEEEIDREERIECEAIAAYRYAAIALTFQACAENYNRAIAAHETLSSSQRRLLDLYQLRKRLVRASET
jgi:hypothetical protein